MFEEKMRQIKDLVVQRRSSVPVGYKCFSHYFGGCFDAADSVTPWSNEARNLDANLMIIGQDWASDDWVSKQSNKIYACAGRNRNLTTNKNLETYLKMFGLTWSDIYATNAFVFVKPGGIGARISRTVFDDSVRQYLIPQLDIIKPKMAVCLGDQTLNSLRRCLGYSRVPIAEAHLAPAHHNGTLIYGTYHPGGRGTANAGGRSAALEQWRCLSEKYLGLPV